MFEGIVQEKPEAGGTFVPEAEAKVKGQEMTENMYLLGTASDSAWLSVTWEGGDGRGPGVAVLLCGPRAMLSWDLNSSE